jgi:alpha-tubulin suppressor-like RCC1 family protein
MRSHRIETIAFGLALIVGCGSGGADDSATPPGGDDPVLAGSASPGGTAPGPGAIGTTGTSASLDCGGHGCGVTQIALGTIAACALLEDATVACYGGGIVGTLGRGAERPMIDPVPKRVAGLQKVAKVLGGGYTMCAVHLDGAVSCWGADQSQNPYGARPGELFAVEGLSKVSDLAVSTSHTCALVDGGDLYCFGSNYFGELGDGTTDNSKRALKVPGISGAKHVATGAEVTCAVLATGDVSCWGMNDHGQLGQGYEDKLVHSEPLAVGGLGAPAVSVAASSESGAVCALLESGASKCWGEQLAVANGPLSGAALAVGWNHACTLDAAGVSCWGANTKGQLGGGSNMAVSAPVTIAGLAGAAHLVTGGNSSCVIVGAGSFACWGDDSRGQLGSGRIGPIEPMPQRRHF